MKNYFIVNSKQSLTICRRKKTKQLIYTTLEKIRSWKNIFLFLPYLWLIVANDGVNYNDVDGVISIEMMMMIMTMILKAMNTIMTKSK